VDELTPEARAILATARPAFTPSAEQLARLHARRLAIPNEPSEPPPAAEASAAGWTIYVVVAVVIAAVIAVVLATRPPAVPSNAHAAETRESDGGTDDAIDAPAELVVAPQRKPPIPSTVTTAVEAPTPLAPEERRAAASPRPRPKPAPAIIEAPAPPEPTPPDADPLAAQLELIGGARRAINAERWSRADELVAEYRRRFPDGVFVDEADVLELLSACGAHPGSDSQARARRHLARPRAPFAERVRRQCLGGAD
jgi:hypothetical protein